MPDIIVESDRIPMQLTRSVVFRQGDLSNLSMTFSIPQEVVFWGQRLELIPQVRSVPLDGSAPAKVWTRASWTIENDAFPTSVPATTIDVLWRVSSTVDGVAWEYQNAPCSIPLLFGYSPFRYTDRAYPSAMEFDQEWYLPGGSAFTVTITPTYATSATAPDLNEYKIVGVLTGTKEVF